MTASEKQTILDAIAPLQQDISEIKTVLIGDVAKPDCPGLVERVRKLEALKKGINWVGGIVMGAIILDIVVRFISVYKGQ